MTGDGIRTVPFEVQSRGYVSNYVYHITVCPPLDEILIRVRVRVGIAQHIASLVSLVCPVFAVSSQTCNSNFIVYNFCMHAIDIIAGTISIIILLLFRISIQSS